MVKLLGFVLDGVEDEGSIAKAAEAGEEGDEAGLENVLAVEAALDDLWEELPELAAVGAELEQEV